MGRKFLWLRKHNVGKVAAVPRAIAQESALQGLRMFAQAVAEPDPTVSLRSRDAEEGHVAEAGSQASERAFFVWQAFGQEGGGAVTRRVIEAAFAAELFWLGVTPLRWFPSRR